MAAVIDPLPKVLPENVTLVFKNMQVYTLLFRYVYLCFNWIGVSCFCLFHERETPIVHSFLIWVTMLSSFPSVETKFWWLAHNLKTARDLINKWALHPIWLPAIFLICHLEPTTQEGGGVLSDTGSPPRFYIKDLRNSNQKINFKNWFLLNNKFRPQLWRGLRDLHVENYFLTWRITFIFYIYDALTVSY